MIEITTDISIKKTLEKTSIEVSEQFMYVIFKKYYLNYLTQFIPPLFDEFTIIISEEPTREKCRIELLQQMPEFRFLSKEEQEIKIDETIKYVKNGHQTCQTGLYCKYHTATNWTLIFFDNTNHTKLLNIEVEYSYEKENEGTDLSPCVYHTSTHYYQYKGDDTPPDEIKALTEQCVKIHLAISYYMEHHSQEVEYSKVEVSPLTRNTNQTSTKSNYNKGYSQKIKLKSKRKKYIIDGEPEKKTRTYQKHKTCWYVRGYYQHFGKEKVLKYIPPRINQRDKDKINKPTNQKYIITE